jgi:hypothetical protein
MKTVTALMQAGFLISLGACAMPPLPPPAPTASNVGLARASGIAPVAVGAFSTAPTLRGRDQSISVRAGSMAVPGGFAQYLGDTLTAELQAAGKLDAKSRITVSGILTDSHVDSAMPTGSGRLAATFVITRDGKEMFSKPFVVSAEWPSASMGAVAIPDAMNNYAALYPKLVAALLSDAEFKDAAR